MNTDSSLVCSCASLPFWSSLRPPRLKVGRTVLRKAARAPFPARSRCATAQTGLFYRTVTNSTACTNSAFGDPAVGVVKTCDTGGTAEWGVLCLGGRHLHRFRHPTGALRRERPVLLQDGHQQHCLHQHCVRRSGARSGEKMRYRWECRVDVLCRGEWDVRILRHAAGALRGQRHLCV